MNPEKFLDELIYRYENEDSFVYTGGYDFYLI